MWGGPFAFQEEPMATTMNYAALAPALAAI